MNRSKIKITVKSDDFTKIPGSLFAYWASESAVNCFNYASLSSFLTTREGMATADNDTFLRLWHELNLKAIDFHCKNNLEALNKHIKWVPYNKGGGTRDWYGNNDYVVNWENDGFAIKHNFDTKTKRLRSHNYNGEYGFLEGITWSAISSGDISVRYAEHGFLFDSKGAKGFCDDVDKLKWALGLLNSKVSMVFLEFLSPTLDFKVGDIILIPYIHCDTSDGQIVDLVDNLVGVSKEDWDSFETSWDFKRHPLL